MLDIGWTEIVVVAVVALVVLGPRELPRALKTFGAVMAKARSMAREFQSGVDEMIRESELDDLRKDLQKATRIDFDETPAKRIDPTTGTPAQAAIPDATAPEAPDQPALPAAEAVPETGLAAPAEDAAAAPVQQVPAAAYPTTSSASPAAPSIAAPARAVAGPADLPFGAQGFDRDYPGATEAQAAGDFLPPDSADGAPADTPSDSGVSDETPADRAAGSAARAAE